MLSSKFFLWKLQNQRQNNWRKNRQLMQVINQTGEETTSYRKTGISNYSSVRTRLTVSVTATVCQENFLKKLSHSSSILNFSASNGILSLFPAPLLMTDSSHFGGFPSAIAAIRPQERIFRSWVGRRLQVWWTIVQDGFEATADRWTGLGK